MTTPDAPGPSSPTSTPRPTLSSLALAYAAIGCAAFGGGLAALPVFQRELATRRRWLTPEAVSDAFAAAQLVPGVILANTAVLTALPLGGRPAAVVAVLAACAPAVLLVSIVALGWTALQSHPLLPLVASGLRPAVVALLLWAAWRLLFPARQSPSALPASLSVILAIALAALLFCLRISPVLPILAVLILPPLIRRRP